MSRCWNKLIQYVFVVGIAFICLLVFAAPAQGSTILTKSQTRNYLDKISEYEISKVAKPTYGSVGGEWLIMGLARYGTLTEDYLNLYLNNLKSEVKKSNGVLSKTKYTEYARVVLALTSVNTAPDNFEGYNLLRPLAELDNVVKTGMNSVAFCLLALDCGNYEIPDIAKEYTGEKTTREKLISILLNNQLNDGGWAITGKKSEADVTAMVLQALSKYRKQEKIEKAVENGVKMLSFRQSKSGAFSSGGSENCESTAQVLAAMTALEIKVTDSRFIKYNHTVLDGLLQYYMDGGFKHTKDSFVNQMSTEQAMYSLTAYYRSLSDENGLYNMKDNKKTLEKKTKVNKRKDNIILNQKINHRERASKETDITGQNKMGDSLQKNTDADVKETQADYRVKKNTKGKLDRKNNKAEEAQQKETAEINSQENMTKERMVQDNKLEKNDNWIGIILGVLGLTVAGILLKRRNKLFIMLITVCLIFGGCTKSNPENEIKETAGSCTILVECSTIYDNLDNLDKGLKGHIPKDGVILKEQEVSFKREDSVYDILSRELKKNNILMEASFTGMSAYIEGIDNIYEFSCGGQSGWLYCVNGEYQQKSCSEYKVKSGDKIEWHYTCNLGEDVR
ncbi:MAG: DUF4430 domain-containing protein [Eubacterium sp.]|nr:DUF4430 domain-containing protein [Eubacterium sp.]